MKPAFLPFALPDIGDEEIAHKRELAKELGRHPGKVQAPIDEAGDPDREKAEPRQGL